jgi:hypothetical protein
MRSFTPADVAIKYRTPLENCEGAPPLEKQFPGCSLPVLEGGARLLRALYDSARTKWESAFDLVFVEFRYDHRYHPLFERPEVEAIRRELMVQEELWFIRNLPEKLPDVTEEAVRGTVARENELTLELLTARHFLWQGTHYARLEHAIESEQAPTAPDPFNCLPERLRTIALRARALYEVSSDSFLSNTDACRGMACVEDLLERYSSLSEQCYYLSRQQERADQAGETDDTGC